MPPRQGLDAPWCTTDDLPCTPTPPEALDEAGQAAWIADWLLFASDVLFQLSGRQWSGALTETVRPIGCGCVAGPGPRHAPAGSWCGCGGVDRVKLARSPLVSVDSVKIDGATLEASAYTVDDDQWLVRLDGSDWPSSQDLRLADTEVGTWSVTYTAGVLPPVGGVKSAASLACQLMAAATPEAECRLPQRITAITRQGVTVAVLDPLTLFADGLTGLAEVDLWLGSLRHGRRGAEPTVVVPERARAGRVVRRP